MHRVPNSEETVPTYQYACTACGHELEKVQSFTDDPLTQCPECDGRLRKLFGSVGVVFKGPGFYRTDSRAGVGNGAGAGAGAGKATGDAAGTEGGKTGSGGTSTDTASSGGGSGSSSSSKDSKPAATTTAASAP
jgi:putative FmdB family regulatory protein